MGQNWCAKPVSVSGVVQCQVVGVQRTCKALDVHCHCSIEACNIYSNQDNTFFVVSHQGVGVQRTCKVLDVHGDCKIHGTPGQQLQHDLQSIAKHNRSISTLGYITLTTRVYYYIGVDRTHSTDIFVISALGYIALTTRMY